MLRNTENSYGLIAKLLHWTITVAILIMAIAGISMKYFMHAPEKYKIYTIHEATGVVAFFLISIRYIWHLTNVKVPTYRFT
ncbi:MAG: cytochrome b/b6 domain-containing protein [Candidatus Rickettsia vulgarisii]